MKAVVAAFNQEKALVGAFSVIMNLRMELFAALVFTLSPAAPSHFLHRTGGTVTAVTWPRDICMDPGNIALSASITP